MPKKDNNSLLKPESAVEDFLDTLLQESTEKVEVEKPVRLKPKILLMPDLELDPQVSELEISLDTANTKVERETVVERLVPLEDPSPVEFTRHVKYQFPLQCLMFSVACNQLSIPLIDMGSVLAWGDRLTLLPNSPDWFLGILQHRDINVKVVDTAKIIHINTSRQENSETRHILIFGDDNWAITCDNLGDVVNLNEDDIKWSKQGSKNLSLGTIKQSLAILLDPNKIVNQLNEHEEND